MGKYADMLLVGDIDQPENEDQENIGMIKKGNIDLYNRPILKNKDGSISTVRSMSVGFDDGEYLIPTVGPNGEDWSPQQAVENFKQTGKHLGVFDTPENATKYSEKLHKQQESLYVKNQPKASELLLSPEIQEEYSETPEISTITGEPVKKWTPTGVPGASLSALFKSGFVDDPATQVKIFAKSRGIPEDRYAMVDDRIVFQGDDGKWYPETKIDALGQLKKIFGQSGADLPAATLGAAGSAFGGAKGAIAGAMAGEAIRKGIGKLAFDEPQKVSDYVVDLGLEGIFAVAGELGGKITKAGINKAGAKMGGKIAEHAGRGRSMINIPETRAMENAGKELGIDLYPPQTTGSKALSDKFKLLGDLEASSDIIQTARKKQQKQINNAVYDFFDSISPDKGKLTVGKELKDASQKSIDRPIQIRRAKAKPLYDNAFSSDTSADVKPVVDWIDEKLKTAKGDVRSSLEKAKSFILKPDIEGKQILNKQGQAIAPDYETSIRGLHDAKLSIDNEISKAKASGLGSSIKYNYQKVKALLLQQMDKASPDYAKARRIFSDFSEEVEKQGKKTLVADISKLENDQVVKASRNLFRNIATSPETVSKARRLIRKESPEAWDAALRTHLQDIFETTKSSAGGVDVTTNIGGNFYKRVWGDPQQKKIMKSAMSPSQYRYAEKLFKVLNRAGMILGKESATATRQEMINEIGGSGFKRTIQAATRPLYTKERIVGDWLINLRLGRNARSLANAMVSEKGARQLQKMYQLSPRSEKIIPMLTDFVAIIGGGALKRSDNDELKQAH